MSFNYLFNVWHATVPYLDGVSVKNLPQEIGRTCKGKLDDFTSNWTTK